eukprot:TRINITY_DN31559_c0_g1_i1.p1 TRINITY_DN31559_c0_g1~~TRINITY_DN31559_c0_g1_i1.p1  ORF type:complete len:694 (+),score=226.92 TRINITY_DN31559_c0_g1_i1:43-2124(+)
MPKPNLPNCKIAESVRNVNVTFSVHNVKEQSVHIDWHDDPAAEDGGAKSLIVHFETFAPTKKFEKELKLAEPVARKFSCNVTSKNVCVTLTKAAFASTSPKASPKAGAQGEPVLEEVLELTEEKADEAEAAATSAPREEGVASQGKDSKTTNGRGKATEKAPAASESRHSEPVLEAADLMDEKDTGNGEAGKKKKKKATKKKGKKAASDDEEEDEDVDTTELVEAKAELTRLEAELRTAEGRLMEETGKDSKAGAARDREKKASDKVRHLQGELKKWQAELDAAKKAIDECLDGVSGARADVAEAEAAVKEQHKRVAEAEKSLKERRFQAAEAERLKREEEERQQEEEKKQLQEERRLRTERERKEAAEEKKRKEAERKENAKRREQERKEKEEEEERKKLERKGMAGPPPSKAGLGAGVEKSVPVYVGDETKKLLTSAMKTFEKDKAKATKTLEDAAKGAAGPVALLALSQCCENHGDTSGCATALLKALAHPQADDSFNEKDRNSFAMKVVGLLKDDEATLKKCKQQFEQLAPKYPILSMGSMWLDDSPPKRGTKNGVSEQQEAAARQGAREEPTKPWTGPLIEEVDDEPPPLEPAHVSAGGSADDIAKKAGWSIDEESGGVLWKIDLPIESIESLAEVNLDISSKEVLLTPIAGGSALAQLPVPSSADADETQAKWSKKRRVLTLKMPRT